MSNIFLETSRMLERYAEQHQNILVAYSGGKDSLAVLDLCHRAFARVTCYHMYFVPGLELVERQLQYARDRWSVEILQYPHFDFLACLKYGIYRPSHHSLQKLPDLGPFDVKDLVMHDTGIDLVADGSKASDSMGKRRQFSNAKGRTNILYPLKEWNKYDVLAYLQMRKIPLPPAHEGNTSGIGLSTRSLRWLHENFPDDFERLSRYFPYAKAAICRKQWYGIG